jgi:hypothetical protein
MPSKLMTIPLKKFMITNKLQLLVEEKTMSKTLYTICNSHYKTMLFFQYSKDAQFEKIYFFESESNLKRSIKLVKETLGKTPVQAQDANLRLIEDLKTLPTAEEKNIIKIINQSSIFSFDADESKINDVIEKWKKKYNPTNCIELKESENQIIERLKKHIHHPKNEPLSYFNPNDPHYKKVRFFGEKKISDLGYLKYVDSVLKDDFRNPQGKKELKDMVALLSKLRNVSSFEEFIEDFEKEHPEMTIIDYSR